MAVPWLAVPRKACAQSSAGLRQILERIERLEHENQALKEEVRALREQISGVPGKPTVEERAEIQEKRIEEQAQTKVEASQRFPVRLTGMILFNAFANSRQNGGTDNPTIASLARGNASGGATVRQTTLGFDYDGPRTFAGGQMRGSLLMDFFGGGGASLPLASIFRIRTATVAVDWKSTTVSAGQDKPLFSPRDPDSIAQVGVSPLTGAGNLWLWVPQVRVEQRFGWNDRGGVRAQLGLVQATETAANVPAAFASTLERFRPGMEGRLEFARSFGAARVEIAPGFHSSTTHVAATAVPSRVYSVDWLIRPMERLELTGIYWTGRNVAKFGTGAIRQGFTVNGLRDVTAVESDGGWAQLKIQATDRLSFHLMHGQQQDSRIRAGIGSNRAYGANFFYRLAPNVLFSFETVQSRTLYLGTGRRLNNHYDLGFAYLF